MLRHLLALVALLLFTGCTEERTQAKATTDTSTEKNETITVSGDFTVPVQRTAPDGQLVEVLVPVPVNLTINRRAIESEVANTATQSQTNRQIDGAAIGAQIATIASKAIDAGIQKLTGGLIGGASSRPAPGILATPEGQGLAVGAAGTLMLALQQTLANRKNKKDADEAWEEIKLRARVSPAVSVEKPSAGA